MPSIILPFICRQPSGRRAGAEARTVAILEKPNHEGLLVVQAADLTGEALDLLAKPSHLALGLVRPPRW
jgi:hypothetical protein